MTKGNGYLRQGEFRRWAAGVDDKLADLDRKATAHGQQLAVLGDRQTQNDAERGDRRRLFAAIVASMLTGACAILIEIWHMLKG